MMKLNKIFLFSFLVVTITIQLGCKNQNNKTPVLSAHIPFDEGQGQVVSDVISGIKGSMVNMDAKNAWTSGLLGGALHFDGKDDRVVIPNNPAIDFADEDFTVSFMMRWPKGVKPGHQHLFTKGDYEANVPGETGKRWEITLIGIGVCFNIDDDVNRSSLLVPFDAFITGEWVHVVMVRDTKAKRIRAYVDGVPQKSTRPYDRYFDGVDRVGNISNPQNLFIGMASRLDNPFLGEMDDIRIYKSALTPQQIAKISEEAGLTSTIKVASSNNTDSSGKPRILITSDGEIDDECSLVRFLLYTNEWDVEGIITSSSQYHWQGHKWAGDDWAIPYLEAYEKVYPSLILHDKNYPTPDYLKSVTLLGNVAAEGEMDSITPGSQHIVKVLLDESDNNPVWVQAWGGINTIARALKTIEEEHPEKMEYVANKLRFFFIWEQDSTYQAYIRPHWGKYNILTIISDQFVTLAYGWDKNIPTELHTFFKSQWMTENILQNHGPLCSLYRAHDKEKKRFVAGDFRSEGDSPAFMHTIVTGLRSMESPGYGGWGGRYVKVHENIWLDPVLDTNYVYPTGIYKSGTGGRHYVRDNKDPDQTIFDYCKPIWRWSEAFQNDWAARADWCVMSYDKANHPPVVLLDHPSDRNTKIDRTVQLSAKGTNDPDGDELIYRWWQYEEADSYKGSIKIQNSDKQNASFVTPADAKTGDTIHVICEVTDKGSPQLTRYQYVVLTVR